MEVEECPMAERSVYHVVPDANHGWKIRAEDTYVGTQGYPTQEEAIARAKEMAQVAGIGHVIVHDINGAVVDDIALGEGPLRRAG
jgi:hypothetical protein